MCCAWSLSRYLSVSIRGSVALFIVLGCGTPKSSPPVSGHSRWTADSVMTLFDSLAAIHRDHPDTGLLRRLHPPGDTILFVEGATIERMTGDSLFRRVIVLHVPVSSMSQRFANRSAHFLGEEHAVLTATERVDWTDRSGAHVYEGLLSVVASRRGNGWVIRAYRGT
jgi:hypothetical protein